MRTAEDILKQIEETQDKLKQGYNETSLEDEIRLCEDSANRIKQCVEAIKHNKHNKALIEGELQKIDKAYLVIMRAEDRIYRKLSPCSHVDNLPLRCVSKGNNPFEIIKLNENEIIIKGPMIPLKKNTKQKNKPAIMLSEQLKEAILIFLSKEKDFRIYKKAAVNFMIEVPNDWPEIRVSDPDNINSKPFLDALGLLLIEDDSLNTIHYEVSFNKRSNIKVPETTISIKKI